jgi:diadenosine tetraphosphate (Ap4A) HIT family hydrolase
MVDCAFCDYAALPGILHESEHFRLVADHAPVVDGHLLIIPREHFACYGGVPAALEPEWLALKARVAEFLGRRYRMPLFFEHGVFRQTVFHAHLHAIPLGAESLPVEHLLAQHGGQRVTTPADVRAWYAERGHYYYVEQPQPDGRIAAAALFPPDLDHYFRVSQTLHAAIDRVGMWAPPPIRRLTGGPKMAALASAWREYTADAPNPAPRHK